MIQFISLNTITTDVLEIIRQSKVSRSEPISKRQIEGWVHRNRAVLIKRDLDKGKMPNPDYIQEIPAVELEVVDRADGSNIDSANYMLKSKLPLPNTIDLNFKSGFMFIGTLDGREFQLIPEGRSQWQQYKRYTNKDNVVFTRNGYLYLLSTDPLRYITVRGVFEVPTEVSNFINPNMPVRTSNTDDHYPIPITLVPALIDMILKNELGIEYKMLSDKSNDSASNFESNTEGK